MSVARPDSEAGTRTVAPAQRFARSVRFIGEVAKDASGNLPTFVEIYSQDGKWYCQVRCGDRKTRPMGPYTKQQAERIQDARRLLLAETGTARLVFERDGIDQSIIANTSMASPAAHESIRLDRKIDNPVVKLCTDLAKRVQSTLDLLLFR